MPNHRPCAESEAPAAILKPPANVDVVAGDRSAGSNPPISTSFSLRNAMLQPGMCSASRSESSTCAGPPGALSKQSATMPQTGWRQIRTADPTYVESRNAAARYLSQCGSGNASLSRYATISPFAASSPVFRALLRPRFGVLISRTEYSTCDGSGPIGRAVVDDDDFEVGIVDAPQALEALPDRALRVEGADDHRDAGPAHVGAEGYVRVSSADDRKRGLRACGRGA